jgi:hypothetical protein
MCAIIFSASLGARIGFEAARFIARPAKIHATFAAIRAWFLAVEILVMVPNQAPDSFQAHGFSPTKIADLSHPVCQRVHHAA